MVSLLAARRLNFEIAAFAAHLAAPTPLGLVSHSGWHDRPEIYKELDPNTLFFIFYYQQGQQQQLLSAQELKSKVCLVLATAGMRVACWCVLGKPCCGLLHC